MYTTIGGNMDLLNLLMGSMAGDESVDEISRSAGLSKKTTRMLILLAIPILIKYLTKNASSPSGAQSLAGALQQHTSTAPMTQQFANANAQDGSAIIGHILGNNSNQVISQLAAQSGATPDQVASILSNIAPGLLSGVSAATTSAQQSQNQGAFDLTDLLGAFGGQQSTASAGGSLLSSLLGGGGSSASGLASLLGGSGGGASFNNSNNGNDLIGSLLSVLGQ